MNSLKLNKHKEVADSKADLAAEVSPIRKFYTGKSILVTGSTGFIGKVLLEKLLYSCPDLDKIYLLIRGSKGKSPGERLAEMATEKPLITRLKQDFILDKLVAIDSDLVENRLGLSDEDYKTLADNVSVIFHVAASVKFEAPLDVNMRHNVVATKQLLEFACEFKQLSCFVHVSTAYSNCQLLQIEERIYPMEVPSDPMSLEVTEAMIDNRPNTYTYTKAMAENVVSMYAARINVVIVRPSIVMSALKEPAPGWVDTINGPVGLSMLGALGILQKIKVNSEVVFDLIPVDIVANALVSIAWAATDKRDKFRPGSSVAASEESNNNTIENNDCTNEYKSLVSRKIEEIQCSLLGAKSQQQCKQLLQNHNHNNQLLSSTASKKTVTSDASASTSTANRASDGTVRVFNLTTGAENPCSFYEYFSSGREEALSKPSARALRPLLTIPKQKGMNPIQYWIHKIFSHLLFAYIIDFLLLLLGQKKMVIKAVKKMHHANEMFDYFCSNQWNFVTDNVKQLRQLQTSHDKDVFNCDVRAINWRLYAQIGWLGCRRFILKEDDDTIGYAKRRYAIICFIYRLVKVLLLLLVTSLARYCIGSTTLLAMLLVPFYGVVYLL